MTETKQTVTPIPHKRFTPPAATPTKFIAPAQPAPVKAITPPIAAPVYAHARPQLPRQPVVVNNNYYNSTPHYNNTPPRYYPQQTYSSSGGFLTGLFTGGLLGLVGRGVLNNGTRPQPYQESYAQPTSQYDATGPMHPAKFESMMEAAYEGRQDTRVRRNGEVVPTTEEDRKLFKQVMFNLMQRGGKPIDQRAMFIPAIMYGPYAMPAEQLGTHITHFSDNFGSQRLSQQVDANYDFLRDSYAQEYRAYKEYQANHSAPRYPQRTYAAPSYQQPSAYRYASSSQTSLGFIKLFGA